MVDDLKLGNQQVIYKQDNQITAIHYENVNVQGKIQAKDQLKAAFQRCYVGYNHFCENRLSS